ncbi:unnamed protein product (mitochondrion) [Plasmodiophora brassicae]|uniref:Uncharacterized protein n=1 Tax=Plasmodiophora brassicae TaxID=37360 RepID=A0A0G4J8V3_PLABS|nr:hypothetical protein PBRA_009557 [Plasmodiophora brassicae]SPR01716.1 unnamed protein product [Plasmodiophora brassicae]
MINLDFARMCLNADELDRRQMQRQQAVAVRFANGAVLAGLTTIIVCIPPLIPPNQIVSLRSGKLSPMKQLKTPDVVGSLKDVAARMMTPMPLPGTGTVCGNVNRLFNSLTLILALNHARHEYLADPSKRVVDWGSMFCDPHCSIMYQRPTVDTEILVQRNGQALIKACHYPLKNDVGDITPQTVLASLIGGLTPAKRLQLTLCHARYLGDDTIVYLGSARPDDSADKDCSSPAVHTPTS